MWHTHIHTHEFSTITLCQNKATVKTAGGFSVLDNQWDDQIGGTDAVVCFVALLLRRFSCANKLCLHVASYSVAIAMRARCTRIFMAYLPTCCPLCDCTPGLPTVALRCSPQTDLSCVRTKSTKLDVKLRRSQALSRSFRSKWDRERMGESAPSLGESKSEGRQSSKQTQNQKRPSNRSVVKQKARCRRHISTYICLYVCSSLIIVFLLLSFCFRFFLALHDMSFVGALHHVRRYCCCLVIGKWEAVGDQVQVQYVEERWQT